MRSKMKHKTYASLMLTSNIDHSASKHKLESLKPITVFRQKKTQISTYELKIAGVIHIT